MKAYEVEQEKERNRVAAIISLSLSSVILALLIIFGGWSVPDPLPKEEIIELLEPEGSEAGGGNQETIEPASNPSAETEQEEVQPQESEAEVETETQEEESVEVDATEDPVEEEDEPEDPQPDSGRLYPGNTSGSNNDNSNGGGSGSGSGGGNGNNAGPGSGSMGNGNWHLAGRGIVNKPVIRDEIQEEGTVVIDIIVDRSGKVVRATVNLIKSTTSSQVLISRAKKAALKATFTPKPDAAVEQKGDIVFVFTKQ